MSIALLAFASFTVPHVVYHATHPFDALTGVENAINVVTLTNGLVLAAVFAWGLRAPHQPVTVASVARAAPVSDPASVAGQGVAR